MREITLHHCSPAGLQTKAGYSKLCKSEPDTFALPNYNVGEFPLQFWGVLCESATSKLPHLIYSHC